MKTLVTPTIAVPFIVIFLVSSADAQNADTAQPRGQNPSPMVETTRPHRRIDSRILPGFHQKLARILPTEVDVFVAAKDSSQERFGLLIHFHGASFITHNASSRSSVPLIAVTVNLGSGSQVYGDAFHRPEVFHALVDSVVQKVQNTLNRPIALERTVLSAFSAGYGAVRNILSWKHCYDGVDAVLLLDGIHASYIPESTVIAEGGRIDSADVAQFLALAAEASKVQPSKRFLITHSEIFPGTYVSTTEATDFILSRLELPRSPVLQWGPMGMQLLSDTRRNGFRVMGFAGNTAPDHVDHLHALHDFLEKLFSL